jgi:tetratricopeptide (TPR) repeat protein
VADYDPDARDPEPGYAWDLDRQERELPEEEYHAHQTILEEMEDEDLEALDLSRAGDYILWAAAQAFEDLGRSDAALPILKRIARSSSRHPALSYPDILVHLADALKDRGEYGEALESLERAEQEDPQLADACRDRRAEVLILQGSPEEGLLLFEKAVRDRPDDPWIPLAAAWALVQRGDYERATSWIDRGAKMARRLDDEEEAREAASEIDRLREETAARLERRRRFGAPGDKDRASDAGAAAAEVRSDSAGTLAGRRQAILADLDAEEVRLVAHPPRDETERTGAADRMAALYARASEAWDDAVESRDESLIAAFDDLCSDVAGVAGRFGIPLPDAD